MRALAKPPGPGRPHSGVLCRPVGVARPFLTSDSAGSRVAPATWSGVAEGSGGGCNSELGFCGMSGKSGGRVGGLTGGGSGWGLSSSGLGMALVLEDVRLTRINPCLFRWASKHGQRGWHLPRPAGGHCAQRRHRGYAALRHDYRQGRQDGRVGASKRFDSGLATGLHHRQAKAADVLPGASQRSQLEGRLLGRPFSFRDRRNNTAHAVFRTQGALFLAPQPSALLPRLRVPTRAGLFSAAPSRE